ncbi:MAG: sulfatase-like hydrolase/transferase, partial [Verrucomicrobiales bacterium]|nr:sulfatase-like hydrolase/transferase [Verrucomicrobiales bacterium]
NGSATSASLLTGRYHYRTGVVGESGPEARMYGSEKTLGECFAENGYRTSWTGKWYHGENWPQNAIGQGFAEVREKELPLDLLQSKDDTPFFSMVMLSRPAIEDGEKLTPEERSNKVNQGITSVDKDVGTLLEALDSAGRRDNTIVIFLSDNGPDHFGETEGRFNGYFYGGKGSVHEGGVRVPCFVSWPENIRPGSRFTRITAHIDWYPTLLQLCGLTTKSRQLRVDGTSLAVPLYNQGSSENWPNRILFTSWTPPGYDIKNASVSVRTDRWLALRDPRWRRDQSVVKKSNGWELYDLKTDPFQSEDRGGELPFLLSELRADFGFWLDHTTDDGIGPVSTHIGYREWPAVTLGPVPEMKWPVRIIKKGEYEFEVDFAPGTQSCEITAGGTTITIPGNSKIQLSDNITDLQVTKGNITELRIKACKIEL